MDANTLLTDMLARAPAAFDKRPGSALYTALAPCAYAISSAYAALDTMLERTFLDTALDDDLDRRAQERGLIRRPATNAVLAATFLDADAIPLSLPSGTRLWGDAHAYTLDGDGNLICQTPGSAGNTLPAYLVPEATVPLLHEARPLALLTPGTDAENDDSLRARAIDALRHTAFAGNASAYRSLCLSQAGISGVRIYPAHAGGGTVRLCLMAPGGAPPEALIGLIRELVEQNAPIGHEVTVDGVRETAVDMTLALTMREGALPTEAALRAALSGALSELSQSWMDSAPLSIHPRALERALIALEGVSDAHISLLGGASAPLLLAEDEVPVLGAITLSGEVS